MDIKIGEHMIKKQKKWSKPQLVILARGKSEENVLAGCKGNKLQTSQNANFNGCMKQGNCSMVSCTLITSS